MTVPESVPQWITGLKNKPTSTWKESVSWTENLKRWSVHIYIFKGIYVFILIYSIIEVPKKNLTAVCIRFRIEFASFTNQNITHVHVVHLLLVTSHAFYCYSSSRFCPARNHRWKRHCLERNDCFFDNIVLKIARLWGIVQKNSTSKF